MEKFELNKEVPPTLKESLIRAGMGDRAFLDYRDGNINAYIFMSNITKGELKEFNGSLTVVFKDLTVPFLVLKYKEASFDMPFLPAQSNGNITNELNIIVIEARDFKIKSMRKLGLNMEIVEAIAEAINFINTLSKQDVFNIIKTQIYPTISPDEMHKGGIRQVFRR